MAIKQILENALKAIESEQDRAVSLAKDRVTREKIIPNNTEIDRSKTEAISALQTQLNQDIAKLQEKFAVERNAINEASEKKKAEFAKSVIDAEVSVVTLEYSNTMSALKKQISEIKE